MLVVFGVNWCGDCKMQDTAFKEGAVAPLISQRFGLVKVNVGKFDRNLAVAQATELKFVYEASDDRLKGGARHNIRLEEVERTSDALVLRVIQRQGAPAGGARR